MDWVSQVKHAVEDFNFTCSRNKCWVDGVLFCARDNLFMDGVCVVPPTTLVEKKTLYDEVKISDHGYESFNASSRTCDSRVTDEKSSCCSATISSISEKEDHSISSQTDQVVILNLKDCETLQKLIEQVKNEALECLRSDEGISSSCDDTWSSKQHIMRFISRSVSSMDEAIEICSKHGMQSQYNFVSELPLTSSPTHKMFDNESRFEDTFATNSAHVILEDHKETLAVEIELKTHDTSSNIQQMPNVMSVIDNKFNADDLIMHINSHIKEHEGSNPGLLSNCGIVTVKCETVPHGSIDERFTKDSKFKPVSVKPNPIARKKKLSRVVRKSLLPAPIKNGRRSSIIHNKKNNLFDSSKWRFFGLKKTPAEARNICKEASKMKPTSIKDIRNSGSENTHLTPHLPSKSRLYQLQKLFNSRSRTEMNKIEPSSKYLTNQAGPSSVMRGKDVASVKPNHLGRNNAFIKCISGRRTSTIDSIKGVQKVSNQASVNQVQNKQVEKPFLTPYKSPAYWKDRKEGLLKAGLTSAPPKKFSNELIKKPMQAVPLKYVMPSTALKPASNPRSTFLKGKSETTPESYDISDLKSDDESYDTPKIRKIIPSWATGHQLIESLVRFYLNPIDVEKIFGTIFAPDLNEMFEDKKPRFDKRTSSANWEIPLAKAPLDIK